MSEARHSLARLRTEAGENTAPRGILTSPGGSSDPVEYLSRIPGIDGVLARTIYRELGISSVLRLERAATNRRLRHLPGMDSREERKLRNGLKRLGDPSRGLTLDWADRISVGIALDIEDSLGLSVIPVGDLRRRSEVVVTPELLVTASAPGEFLRRAHRLVGLPWIECVSRLGYSSREYPYVEVRVSGRQTVRLWICPPEESASATYLLTGSPGHIQQMGLDLQRGLEISDGLLDRRLYEGQDVQFVPPELRRGDGEVALAREHRLPRLVEVGDRRGELHCHTNWSDGRGSIEDMIVAARERGLRYLAITDHSRSLHVAGGLDEEEVFRQGSEIRRLSRKYPAVRVFRGLEVDILEDGSLDMSDSLLEDLDFVLASAHAGLMASGRAGLTERLLAAARHPMVDAIGHPTGRILEIRNPGPPDMDAVLEECRKTGTILEINASPDRLDLPFDWVRRARRSGVGLALNTDAHGPGDMDLISYGVDCARRGWCASADLVNCLDVREFESLLSTPKGERWRLFSGREN